MLLTACGGGGAGANGGYAASPPASPAPPTATAQALPTAAPAPWIPSPSDTFQWQLAGTLDTTVPASVYDLDAFGTPASSISTLHGAGRHAVCYVNAGAFERYRPDAAAFPADVIGSAYLGYPDESWLDIRRIDVLGPIMDARLDTCKGKGFDAVEPDNIEGWQNATGFPLTANDQLAYNAWFAQHVHARGMSIALKNEGPQAAQLLSAYDFVLAESCWSEGSCGLYAPFVNAKKAVFTVEYTERTTSASFHATVCPQAAAALMTAVLKNRNLDVYREVCP